MANRFHSASAVEICVPLSSARPSLAASVSGVSPARFRPSSARSGSLPPHSTSPTPNNTADRCASGARSPLAPTEPLDGMRGSTSAL